jgi:hypothetical protein
MSNITGGLDNRVKSRLNQEKVLRALHRFGWLPVRQVHKTCWPEDETPRSAQRYLAQLLTLKHVTRKEGPDGSWVYALSSLGARRMRVEMGIVAAYDPEFSRRSEAAYQHRILANEVCVWWKRLHSDDGGDYFTEHEIVTGRAPFRWAPQYLSDPKGKIPDAILSLEKPVTGENKYAKWLAWVEVEHADKPTPEHEHMIRSLCDVLAFGKKRWEIGTDSVLKFAVVVCPFSNQEYKLVEGLLQFLGANKVNYDAYYVVRYLHIWRPGEAGGISILEWMLDKPAMKALKEKLGLWWPEPIKQ